MATAEGHQVDLRDYEPHGGFIRIRHRILSAVQRLRKSRESGLRPGAGDLSGSGAWFHPRDATEGVGKARSITRSKDRRTGTDRPVQMDGYLRLVGDATPRVQMCYGRTFHIAYFKAAHGLNPELEARYAANRVGLSRQLHFSERNEKSLDATISVNGVPVATIELKNPLTGQTVNDAQRQYCQDRDPRELIFEFERRTLVHFAVDTEAVFMTTRLAGSATHFLPFNKGCDGGAGNPPDLQGRTISPLHHAAGD